MNSQSFPWRDYILDLTNHSVKDKVLECGWKAGILEYLKKDPELSKYILPWFYISPAQINSDDFPNLPSDFENYTRDGNSLLYRSTDPADIYSYIWILPTLEYRKYIKKEIIKPQNSPLPIDTIKKSYWFWEDLYALYEAKSIYRKDNYKLIASSPGVVRVADMLRSWYLDIETLETHIEIFEDHLDDHLVYEKEQKNIQQNPPNSALQDNPHYKIITDIRKKIAHISQFDLPEYLERYNLPSPTSTTWIYVQPKISWWHVWSVVEHPNRPGTYIVSYSLEWWDIHDKALFTDFIWEDGIYQWGYVNQNYRKNQVVQSYVLEAVEVYKKCKKKKIFDEKISFQMEFWSKDKFYIYQLRQFRPFEESSWKLNAWNKGLSFWTTWPEWIRVSLEIQESINLILRSNKKIINSDNSGLLAVNLQREIHPSIELEKLDLFWFCGQSRPNLQHSLFYPSYVSKVALLDANLLSRNLKNTSKDEAIKDKNYRVFTDWVSTVVETD